jgi:alkanesulfonate monooxygenase SsuD/methylene tetrahydromethanopterin reductase-like flavin-dependent oxidoreductase (luciferase family)
MDFPSLVLPRAEMSPNPLMVQMSVAAHTKRIRLGQAANIIVWHHPVRLAEQIATLDVISGGRVDCGIGRGYQPRENETLGRPYGSTIQDQERNRKAFEEVRLGLLQASSRDDHGALCWYRRVIGKREPVCCRRDRADRPRGQGGRWQQRAKAAAIAARRLTSPCSPRARNRYLLFVTISISRAPHVTKLRGK